MGVAVDLVIGHGAVDGDGHEVEIGGGENYAVHEAEGFFAIEAAGGVLVP
jgi:hypothetical protein